MKLNISIYLILIFILSATTAGSIVFSFIAFGKYNASLTTSLIQRSAVSLHSTRVMAIDTDTKMITFQLLSDAFGMQPLIIASYKDTSVIEDSSPEVQNDIIVAYAPSKTLAATDLRPGDIGYAELAIAADGSFWVRTFLRNDILRSVP